MEGTYPQTWAGLRQPWTRKELLEYLAELSQPDPRPIWLGERERGLASGVDQVVHFFFDDHDFDESDVGCCLFDRSEATLLQELKAALDLLVEALPDGDDDAYIGHPTWKNVTTLAGDAWRDLNKR